MNITQLEARLAQLAELRTTQEARQAVILDTCTRENRATTDEEAETMADVRKQVASIDSEARALTDQVTELRKAEADAAAEAPEAAATEERKADADEARKGSVKVGREPLTYEKHSLDSRSYLADLVLVEQGHGRGDKAAAEARLSRHAAEMRVEAPRFEARMWGTHVPSELGDDERSTAQVEYEKRDLNRTDGTGGYAIPPLWMMQEYINLARGSRITADLCRKFPLPAGTDSINIPKVATGTATAIQTADNAAVTETDLTDDFVTAGVKTIAGQQDISLQAFEQSPLAYDQIILGDLAADHAVKTDVQVISGSNASGQVLGIRTIASVDTTAYTDASPTVPELHPKLADSYNEISTNRFRVPEAIVMHPRRWAWMLAALDSTNRPLVVGGGQGPNNALAAFGGAAAEGAVGMLPFGPIYIDPNIPTTLGGGTEDVIILTRPSDLYLWEGPVRTRVLMEVLSQTLTVRIQLYNYLAFMPHRYPRSTSLVGGTGLAAPTF